MTKFRALEAAENAIWAMETAALERLLSIAGREHDVTPEALEAYQAKALAHAEQATVRDGVAILGVQGDLFSKANILTAMSGATSYDILRRDLQAGLDDPKVKGIIARIDSPGGEVTGANELAAAIYAARGTKPIVAYVEGQACSAAYWIASACSEIVVDATAMLGSIGVQVAMRTRADAAGVTTYKFISSQSPLKNADPGSEAGAKHIQGVVDAMAQVFVDTVARNRGVGAQTVLNSFGKGGILVGNAAVNSGLADRLGNFEGVLADLAGRQKSSTTKGANMAQQNANFTATQASYFPPQTGAAPVDRADGIRRVAAGLGVDPAAAEVAIASGKSVEAFALEHADAAARAHAAAAAAAIAQVDPELENDARVAAIVGIDAAEVTRRRIAGTPEAYRGMTEAEQIEARAREIAAA